MGRLAPDFKIVANFSKENGKVIRGACRQFIVLCQALGLFAENLVAIEGSKFKAMNNRGRHFTIAKLQSRMEEIESSINCYLAALDTRDQQEPNTVVDKPRTSSPMCQTNNLLSQSRWPLQQRCRHFRCREERNISTQRERH